VKALFFHAVAERPGVALALADQARETLRPFHRFLGQAIHTARQRQVRYQLPWERVKQQVIVRLEPLDTLLRVPRRPPDMVLAPWPVDVEPDPSQPAFVVNRSVTIRVESVRRTPEGLLVTTTPSLQASDRVIWCEVDRTATEARASAPPQTVADLHGRPLVLLGTPEAEGDRYWQILVEGRVEGDGLVVDGEEVEVELAGPEDGPKRAIDGSGRTFEVFGMRVRAPEPPADGVLRGDDGVRYRWSLEQGERRRRGSWIRLLPPETHDPDEFLDPRAAFCEGDVREVWTQPRRDKNKVFKVKRVDADRYELLLEQLPPEGTTLYLPVDLRNLYLQRRALLQLAEAPLPHHQGLLRLCEDPRRVRWPEVVPVAIADDQWRALTDETRDGTLEQRAFVQKALGSPDFAFLEGPPGSGKTTAICEIVQQLVECGQRVLLCASTHFAIDNVLERLLYTDSPVDAVRIGRIERVDEKVQRAQLDVRIDALVDAWRQRPSMRHHGDQALGEMAERAVIMAANLTCGTTMGIVNHPLFHGRDEDMDVWERPITTMPHWDVLIVDEASKTLIQELMVPALMAKRWIIVGDVRQLPPFADRSDLEANLAELVDQDDRPIFPRDHQRACLLLFRLLRRQTSQSGMRWLVVEPAGVLGAIERELLAKPVEGLSVVRVVSRARERTEPVALVTVEQLLAGAPEALWLAAADWVLVSEDLLGKVSARLPSSLLLTRSLGSGQGGLEEADVLLLRQGHWLERAGRVAEPYRDDRARRSEVSTMASCQRGEIEWLVRNGLAQQLAWRLTRIHELRHSRQQRERERLRGQLDHLVPYATDIWEPLGELEDIGLPSILEVLQEGIGVERSKRHSALTEGFRTAGARHFDDRFQSLSFQHRMHPEISSFSREVVYGGRALRDANTIAQRDARIGWDFGSFRARRVWAHVAGHEHEGVNHEEVKLVAQLIRDFMRWVEQKGPPARTSPAHWEVACLAFYVKQERALSQMLQRVTGDARGSTRFFVRDRPIEIVCGTVDRFQGREADLVLLSMRNTGRVGFLDSPNRLNVAVTRARQQLVVVGNADYFGDKCGISELEELVRRSPCFGSHSTERRRLGSP